MVCVYIVVKHIRRTRGCECKRFVSVRRKNQKKTPLTLFIRLKCRKTF